MKALVFVGARQLEVQEWPDLRPSAGKVILKVSAVGVCGSDVHGYLGQNGRRFPGQVMGHEAVGVIENAADEHADLIGQTMTFTPIDACGRCPQCIQGLDNRCPSRKLIGVHPDLPGAFAEYVSVPVQNLFKSEPTSNVIGTLIEPLSVAHRAVSSLDIEGNGRVLVLGAGTIGALVALSLRDHSEYQVDIYDPADWKADWLGFRGVRNLSSGPQSEGLDAPAFDIDKYQIVMDCVGSNASIGTAMKHLMPGGQLHIVGMAAPFIEFPAHEAVVREVRISTSYAYTRAEFEEMSSMAKRLEPLLLEMKPVTCTLDEAAERIDSLLDPNTRIPKLVICP